MQSSTKIWRILFAIAIIAIAVQQVVFSVYMPVILPWPEDLVKSPVVVWIGSAIVAAIGALIIIDSKARPAAIYLGLLFLALLIVFHIPNQFRTTPGFLGSWANALKILALSGCAFIVAASSPKTGTYVTGFEAILPAGRFFLAITMLVFGIEHFVYIGFVPGLVPHWAKFPIFWTYFTGVALIAAALGIILNIKLRLAANLLGLMIFIWFLLLHVPRAMADPRGGNGNEIVSAFEALAFSSSAFILAAISRKKEAKSKTKRKKA
ncbi:hypothetical protein EWM62_08735 [Mucilaginibacter terrigena]|uniref:DoxX family membrane protein n=1 Tax=Mucilaginibacter terrigena TaxID=2492395 RepID=A0A4Q5LN70_9SPHI|nr:hypothetical protein [Mucilaginibacter terrigena]RYU90722.1 hypothetical protein EWM62_08735 [Mucilaginibacter terrigena]